MKQIIFNNKNSINQLRTIILNDNPNNILLVTGKKSFSKSGSEKMINKLFEGFKFFRYSDFEFNPKYEDVIKCLNILNKYEFDYIVTIGGGSVIDFAKLVNIGAHNNDLFKDFPNNINNIKCRGSKFIAIPTTSGSGTEATHFAVLYFQGRKFSIANKFLYPDIVLLDSTLTLSLSPNQTAISGIDAFCQSIESYWSVNSTDESLDYSLSALKLILKHLPNAVNNNCKFAKEKMIYASYLAGKAINIAKTTGAHALSYSLTSKHGITHGQAVALTIAEWYRYNLFNYKNLSDNRGLNYYQNKMKKINILFSNDENKIVKEIKKFIVKCNLSVNLSDFNLSSEDLNELVENINLQRLKNNPIFIDKKEIYNLLVKSL